MFASVLAMGKEIYHMHRSGNFEYGYMKTDPNAPEA